MNPRTDPRLRSHEGSNLKLAVIIPLALVAGMLIVGMAFVGVLLIRAGAHR